MTSAQSSSNGSNWKRNWVQSPRETSGPFVESGSFQPEVWKEPDPEIRPEITQQQAEGQSGRIRDNDTRHTSLISLISHFQLTASSSLDPDHRPSVLARSLHESDRSCLRECGGVGGQILRPLSVEILGVIEKSREHRELTRELGTANSQHPRHLHCDHPGPRVLRLLLIVLAICGWYVWAHSYLPNGYRWTGWFLE